MSNDMFRPFVGITTARNFVQDSYFCRNNYIRAVRQAGGVPLLLPPLVRDECPDCVGRIDALLLSGGGDIHSSLFGKQPHWKMGEFDPERDVFEVELLRLMIDLHKPVMGVCRGIQVINVALGGTLYQDLASQQPQSLQHYQATPRQYPTHQVSVRRDSKLSDILGVPRLQVNSLHHQAIKDLATGLQATAWADDGVIEGVEATEHPFLLGVQWHPEGLWEHDQAAASLFRALVNAAVDQASSSEG